MLKHLTLENFKAWEKAEIDYGSITGFFGTNSSGKSSLLQFLLMLKQTVETKSGDYHFTTEGDYAKLGIFRDIIFNHDETKRIDWKIDADVTDVELESYEDQEGNMDSHYVEFFRANSINGFVKLQDKKLTHSFNENKDREFDFDFIHPYEFLRFSYYLGPLRSAPLRDYYWANTRYAHLGNEGEHTIVAILARRLEDPHFEPAIAKSLIKLGIVHSFGMKEIAPGTNRWQALVKIKENSPEIPLTDVGFGVSQVLPVITLLHMVPENSIVLLENPELHLHPSAQANLADVIIDVVKTRKIQVIFESHSEQLLLRLQRRIAEEKIKAEDVKLYFCDQVGGKATLSPLTLDEYGTIQNYPEDFMGDALSEVAHAEISRINRMEKKQNHE